MNDLNWLSASFIVVLLVNAAFLGFIFWGMTNSITAIAEKLATIFALLLIIPAFRKYEYYLFFGINKNPLLGVKVSAKNKKTMLEAVNLVKQKAEIINESYFDGPLPSASPVFQFTEFDFADFLSKSEVRIYEDKIIDVEKSLVEEATTTIKYDELNGQTKLVKTINHNWDNVWCNWLFFVGMVTGSTTILFGEQIGAHHLFSLYLRLFIGGIALLIPLFLLRYIKSDVLIFYDKQDNDAFWTRVNLTNREKLFQIVEFVKNKIELAKEKPL